MDMMTDFPLAIAYDTDQEKVCVLQWDMGNNKAHIKIHYAVAEELKSPMDLEIRRLLKAGNKYIETSTYDLFADLPPMSHLFAVSIHGNRLIPLWQGAKALIARRHSHNSFVVSNRPFKELLHHDLFPIYPQLIEENSTIPTFTASNDRRPLNRRPGALARSVQAALSSLLKRLQR